MIAFLDTSSLVKLYHEEAGSDLLVRGLQKVTNIYLSEIAKLEFRSALWKKVREKEVNKACAEETIQCFEKDYNNFLWIEISGDLLSLASELLSKYGKEGLRTLDSIQLASAIQVKNKNCSYFTNDALLKKLLKEENLQVL